MLYLHDDKNLAGIQSVARPFVCGTSGARYCWVPRYIYAVFIVAQNRG